MGPFKGDPFQTTVWILVCSDLPWQQPVHLVLYVHIPAGFESRVVRRQQPAIILHTDPHLLKPQRLFCFVQLSPENVAWGTKALRVPLVLSWAQHPDILRTQSKPLIGWHDRSAQGDRSPVCMFVCIYVYICTYASVSVSVSECECVQMLVCECEYE